jgi:hypothetical protein
MVASTSEFNQNHFVAFIHIPKTSGSTINGVLKSNLGRGTSFFQPWSYSPEELRNTNWCSGHFTLNDFYHFAIEKDITQPEVYFFSMVREPLSRTLSHLRLIYDIYCGNRVPDEFLERVVLEIKSKSIDFNFNDFVLFTLREYDFLHNVQAKHLLIDNINLNFEDLKEQLSKFKHIGVFPRTKSFVQEMLEVATNSQEFIFRQEQLLNIRDVKQPDSISAELVTPLLEANKIDMQIFARVVSGYDQPNTLDDMELYFISLLSAVRESERAAIENLLINFAGHGKRYRFFDRIFRQKQTY